MSKDNFDKKIREKLVNHIPKYDVGAWANFNSLLPKTWYARLFQNYGSWFVSGLATSALIVTLYVTSNDTGILQEEIESLKIQVQNIPLADTIYIQQNHVDTIFIAQKVESPSVVRPSFNSAKSLTFQSNKGIENQGDEQFESSIISDTNRSTLNEVKQNASFKLGAFKPNEITPTNNRSQTTQNVVFEKSDISELDLSSSLVLPTSTNESESLAIKSTLESDSKVFVDEPIVDSLSTESVLAPRLLDLVEESTIPLDSEEDIEKELADSIAVAKDIIPERTVPEKTKKKIRLPLMRVGLSADYLNMKVWSFGPTVEVFILDKLSFSTGALFSGEIETKHPLPRDFNSHTGKEFDKEFQRFVSEKPENIRDITITTSVIKLPLYFNYYFTTRSRFSFIVSAGTKLDLSVYQNIDYTGGRIGEFIKRRFEARPKPKTFNSMFYGMGVQYQYKKFVGQLTPYFDFKFREPDYYNPSKNFGLNASVKFEF